MLPDCLDHDHAHGCDYDCDEDDLSYGKPNDAAKIEGAAKRARATRQVINLK